jgi:mono/diheme cytochrome c family protein
MRNRATSVIVAAVILVALGFYLWHTFVPGPMAFAGGSTVALADYHAADPTGVPADLAGADPVKRGEYLARAADCMVCHTTPGGAPYAGGLEIRLPFGAIYTTNITPDKDTGIGKYSDADFLNVVQRGVRPDGTRLYPAMPYPSYTYMTDADALAIKAYLFSLPGVALNPNTRFAPNTARSPEWNRGAYLAEALAHCGECHTPRNLAQALDNRKKYAGAVTAGWKAFNISSDKDTGIGSWSDDEVASYLASGHVKSRGTAAGPMGEAVDQSFSAMTPNDIQALVAYVRSVPAVTSDLPATLAPPAPVSPKEGATANAAGKKVFEQACVSCHSWTGVSALSPFATISGTRAVNDVSATNVAQVVLSGTVRHTPDGVVSMPAFGAGYSDADIAAVVNYVTARFGAAPSNLTDKDVAQLRSETVR